MIATPSKSLFHSVAVGYMFGIGLFLLLGLLIAFFMSPVRMPGEIGWVMLLLPAVLVLNAYLTSSFIMLGLWLFEKVRKLNAA